MNYRMYTKKEVGKYHIRFLFLYIVVAGALMAGISFLEKQINPFLFSTVFLSLFGIMFFAAVYLRFVTSLICVENSFIFDKDNRVVAYHRAPLYVSPRELRKIGARIVRHSLDPFCVSRILTVSMWNGTFLWILVQARVGADEANLQLYSDSFVSRSAITPEKAFSSIMEDTLRAMCNRICEMYQCGYSDDDICATLQKSINVEVVKLGLVVLNLSVATQMRTFIIE